jgi:hypothetical protein
MANFKVAVINACNALKDEEIESVIPALQTQVHRDFAPAWGIDADLIFVPKNQNPPNGYWWLVILDDSDQGTDLGFHDLTKEGMPLGKVFAHTDIMLHVSWTVTASHELLEMLADPNINLTAFVQNGKEIILYMYEICDPCETDSLGYKIDDTLVSDFIYPSWFETFWKKDETQFDYGQHIQKPLQILPGGYIGIFDVSYGYGWSQFFPDKKLMRYYERPRVGSRRERRRTPRDEWLKSKIKTKLLRTYDKHP